MPEAIIDTSTLIDLEKTDRRLHAEWAINTSRNFIRYRMRHGLPFLSAVTVLEVGRGLFKDGDPSRAIAFGSIAREQFDIVSVDFKIAFRAARLMAEIRHRTIGVADTLIAATALERDLAVVTSNPAHFRRIADLGYPLVIENWREAVEG